MSEAAEGSPRPPEVWRSPIFNPQTTRPAPPPRHGNDQLVVDLARAGWLKADRLTLDATYGRGVWWKKWRPDRLVAMDAFARKLAPLGASAPAKPGAPRPIPLQADFRRPPFRAGTFPQAVLDAPYKLNGTPTEDVDERYGVDVAAKWQDRFRLLLDGLAWWPPCWRCHGLGILQPAADETPAEVVANVIAENGYQTPEEHAGLAIDIINSLALAGYHLDASWPCPVCEGSGRGGCEGLAPLLAPGGILIAKGMDQVVSQAVRWQATELQRRGEAAGLILVDRLDLPGVPRPQDPDRGQEHARQNVSFALVFERPKGRKRRYVWTA